MRKIFLIYFKAAFVELISVNLREYIYITELPRLPRSLIKFF